MGWWDACTYKFEGLACVKAEILFQPLKPDQIFILAKVCHSDLFIVQGQLG